MTWRNSILVGDVREQLATLPDESVHCVVTSPPYWGLRDYGAEGQLGLEPTPEEFIENMVAVFREVRRVLRKDGTLWLNLGDSYAGSGKGPSNSLTQAVWDSQPNRNGAQSRAGAPTDWLSVPHSLKAKDLVGIPWRVAFALQADGWWLRSDIIWSKPNPMPESVTDRPTKSHEYLFLLTKSERYYYDIEAIKEKSISGTDLGLLRGLGAGGDDADSVAWHADSILKRQNEGVDSRFAASGTRNRRTVWEIPTQPYAEAHFATYPEALVLPCIQAGTSEHGCCSVCGAPWRRVVEPTEEYAKRLGKGYHNHVDDLGLGQRGVPSAVEGASYRTTGWAPTCKHEAPLERAVVLDPFMGSGTSGLVAFESGRDFVGVELNPTYAEMAVRRIGANRGRLL